MKKLLIVLLAVVVFAAACGVGEKKAEVKDGIGDINDSDREAVAAAETYKQTAPTQPKTNIIGNEFVCSGEISGVKMVAYYQGRRFRTEIEMPSVPDAPKTYGIYDYNLGEIWSWNEKLKIGQHGSKEEMEKVRRQNYPDIPENPSYDIIIAEWERQGFTCKEQDLPDSLFEVPSDIEFTEFVAK